MTTPDPIKPVMWLAEPLPRDVSRRIDEMCRAPDVRRVAIMPDVHLAGEFCVGAVVATTELVYPAAVGGDIGCGMAAVRFEADASQLANERVATAILDGLSRRIPASKHRPDEVVDELPDGLEDRPLGDPRLETIRRRDGRYQFGTLGRGNHFVELQGDDTGDLWLMVHSGSRAMGQAITAHYERQVIRSESGHAWLPLDGAGRSYVADAEWAERYAAANRLAMVRAVESILADLVGARADWSTLIHSNHNHVRQETHDGLSFWVHRKGALPAAAEEPGVIPGSMGTRSFHVTGRGCGASLNSSSHGAGRTLTRDQARRSISPRQLDRELRGVWFDPRMTDALRDEAPSAYKDIGKVMKAQRGLTRILRELRPLLTYKGR